jgi:subtilisin-like proprotein convertase family protein
MVAAGGRITSITIEYEVEEEDLGDINVSVTAPDTTVVIAANYYYDLQDITFN